MVSIISADESARMISPGSSVMIGGFLACGSPENIITSIIAQNINNLTVIGNDTGFIDKGIGRLIAAHQVKHVIASHIGTNKETGRQIHAGEITADLIPQGTLAEQIRAAGFGLGGFLTPTGVGTPVAEGKQVISLNGRQYLLEEPLHADIALLKAWKADKAGNLIYRRSARNFNPLMATAAKLVIAEVEEIIEIGEIDPDIVITPGIFVHHLVKSEVSNNG